MTVAELDFKTATRSGSPAERAEGGLMTTAATRREFLGVSLTVAGALAAGCPARSEAVEVGQKAPDFSLASTSGGKIRLSQFRGQPVLIEFYGADFAPV